MQLKARCSNVGHRGREPAPVAEQSGFGHDRGLLAEDGIKRTDEKTDTLGGRFPISQSIGRKRVPSTANDVGMRHGTNRETSPNHDPRRMTDVAERLGLSLHS